MSCSRLQIQTSPLMALSWVVAYSWWFTCTCASPTRPGWGTAGDLSSTDSEPGTAATCRHRPGSKRWSRCSPQAGSTWTERNCPLTPTAETHRDEENEWISVVIANNYNYMASVNLAVHESWHLNGGVRAFYTHWIYTTNITFVRTEFGLPFQTLFVLNGWKWSINLLKVCKALNRIHLYSANNSRSDTHRPAGGTIIKRSEHAELYDLHPLHIRKPFKHKLSKLTWAMRQRPRWDSKHHKTLVVTTEGRQLGSSLFPLTMMKLGLFLFLQLKDGTLISGYLLSWRTSHPLWVCPLRIRRGLNHHSNWWETSPQVASEKSLLLS